MTAAGESVDAVEEGDGRQERCGALHTQEGQDGRTVILTNHTIC